MDDGPAGDDPRTVDAMLGAAKDNDVATLASLLASNASPDSANTISQSALHVASMWGALDAVRLLLSAGARVNARNLFGATPLHCAAQRARLEVGQCLLEQRADPGIVAGNGMAAHEMCPDEGLRAAFGAPRALFHGALRAPDRVAAVRAAADDPTLDVNDRDAAGDTAIIAAARLCDVACLEILTSRPGADLAATNREGLTAVHVAAAAFGAGIDPGARLAAVSLLLDRGADPNAPTAPVSAYATGSWLRRAAGGGSSAVEGGGRTPLHSTIEAGGPFSEDMARLLLDRGADPNAMDRESGAAPLHLALEADALAVAELLLRARADVQAASRDIGADSTPLHAACQRGEGAKAALLIAHGADVARPGRSGLCPLHLAARAGSVDTARLLLEARADAAMADARGRRALEYAPEGSQRHAAVRALLLAACGAHQV